MPHHTSDVMRRRLGIMIAVWVFFAIIVYYSTLDAFGLVPWFTISGIASVAIQVGATLIGFVGIALFYYLGNVETLRKNFLGTQRLLYESLPMREIKKIGWTKEQRGLRKSMGLLSAMVTYSGIASIVAFAFAIFFGFFAMILNNISLMAFSLVSVVSGISLIIMLVSQTQLASNLLNDVLVVVENYAQASHNRTK